MSWTVQTSPRLGGVWTAHYTTCTDDHGLLMVACDPWLRLVPPTTAPGRNTLRCPGCQAAAPVPAPAGQTTIDDYL